jgi:transcriptional regulator with XRE-family HTH domain
MKMPTEREDFSARLQQALRDAEYPPDSPTQLAREFNIRFPGRAITVHAARKWLMGEAIPTQEKLRTLAQWLGVPAEWLRFGGARQELPPYIANNDDGITLHSRFDSDDVKLIADLQRLDERDREIAREVIRLLVRFSRGK